MNESENLAEAQANLLIYIPRPRGTTSEARQRDPFEVFALAGVAFGDTEVEQLASLARQAMPERADEIDPLFTEESPSLDLLDRLESVRRWPLLREALGTESPAEVIALVLCQEERARRIEELAGCLAELRRFLETEIGFRPTGRARSWAKVREQLGTYVLCSEFVLDLPSAVPDALTAIPRTDETYKAKIFSTCERMRTGTDMREGYLQLANRVEAELRLAELTEGLSDIGSRDTFAFQDGGTYVGCSSLSSEAIYRQHVPFWIDGVIRCGKTSPTARCSGWLPSAVSVSSTRRSRSILFGGTRKVTSVRWSPPMLSRKDRPN